MAGSRMSEQDRVRIETLWAEGRSIPHIAGVIGRHRSTVWRELAGRNSYRHGPKNPQGRQRGGVYRWGYDATWAQDAAWRVARRRRAAKLSVGTELRELVVGMLRQRWSPQQIAASLRRDYPDQPEMWVSHETIYRAIYVQSRGGLREELTRQVALRSGRASRRKQTVPGGAVRSARAWITPDLHISQRPAEAADRAVPGHWEGDLLIGAGGRSAIITLVERSTRYVMLGKLPGDRASEAVIGVLSDLIGRLPEHLRRSLAWDCGTELAQHAKFTVESGCPVYFCDPHSPWQRGSNENTNGLLRQYFPKGEADFRTISQDELDDVAAGLNGRPRMTLDWNNPAEALNALLVASAA